MPTLKQTTGFQDFRLKFNENYKEAIFAREWANLLKTKPKLLKELLNADGISNPPDPEEKDCQIVATIIQFLGTREGQDFLKRVLKKCGT